MLYYPLDLKVYWDYGEVTHFKGPHDGIGATVKRMVYRAVQSEKIVLNTAAEFAQAANSLCDVNVIYLDKSDVLYPYLGDTIQVNGILQVHHIERFSAAGTKFKLTKNSPYIPRDSDEETFITVDYSNSEEQIEEEEEIEEQIEVTTNPRVYTYHVDEMVIVNYEGSHFPGRVKAVKESGLVVDAMLKCESTGWKWPTRPDTLFYPFTDILEKVPSALVTPYNDRGVFTVNSTLLSMWST